VQMGNHRVFVGSLHSFLVLLLKWDDESLAVVVI
jgi:hypothetical protein